MGLVPSVQLERDIVLVEIARATERLQSDSRRTLPGIDGVDGACFLQRYEFALDLGEMSR